MYVNTFFNVKNQRPILCGFKVLSKELQNSQT